MGTRSKINSQQGFSLIEALVALAVSGILILASGSIQTMVQSSTNMLSGQRQRNVLESTLVTHLMYKDSCDVAMGVVAGAGTKPINLAQAVTATGVQIQLEIPNLAPGLANLKVGDRLAGRELRVDDIRLFNLSAPIAMASIVAPFELRRGVIHLKLSALDNFGQEMALRIVPSGAVYLILDTTTNPNPIIAGCYSPANRSLSEICAALGGDYDAARIPPCRFPATPTPSCPAGSFWTGLAADGTPLCRQMGTCPANTYMTGINGAGEPVTCHDPEFVN